MDVKSKANFINSVASGQGMPCPNCNTLNKSDSRFCTACGTKLESATPQENLQCPNCNTVNKADSRFCIGCGAELNQKASIDTAPAFATVKEQPAENAEPNTVDEEATEGLADATDTTPAFAAAEEQPTEDAEPNTVTEEVTEKLADATDMAPAFATVEARSEEIPEKNVEVNETSKAVEPIFVQEEIDDDSVSVFAQGLPEWNLEPPQVMVRRHR